jgi:serine/threonine protein kinase
MRPARVRQPDLADEGVVKSWLDALSSGSCDAPAFLRLVRDRFGPDPEGTWEVLSQLDQYYRRGRIEIETFKTIKKALAESALGRGEVPVAQDVSLPTRGEQTDIHHRSDELPLDAVGEPKPGSVLRRRYRIEAAVGHSGMGTVFQAVDEYRLESPGSQRLAVKVLHPAVVKRAELLASLRREFQCLQLLSHPNILRVFEFDRDGALVFFTMELLTGATLGRVLQVRKLIPLQRMQALAAIRDVGAAVAYAHSRGVMHGDLNLQNIFITGPGELRVLGFGGSYKARQISAASDHEMLPFAASAYASCQVLEGERADTRDDVFALACIAYLLLSGDHPFPKRTAIEARDSRVNLRRPANLSGRQWQALRAALRWDRERRPGDVQQWLTQLELPGAAKRLAPLSDLLEPPQRRNWSLSRLATGIAAGVALLLGGAYWINQRDTLPRIDSGAPVRAPAPLAAPPPAPTSTPASRASPVAAPTAPLSAAPPPSAVPARPAASPPAAAPLTAAQPTAAPTAAPAAAPIAPPSAAPIAPPFAAQIGPSKVELATDTVDVAAGESSAQIPVHRKGSLHGQTSFTWWTESGTAKPGADFSAVVPQIALIGDGKSNISLSIPLSKAPHAQSKSFYVVIDQSDGGASVGARTLTMVTLLPSN